MAIQAHHCVQRAPAPRYTADHDIEFVIIIDESGAGKTLTRPRVNESKPVSYVRSFCVKVVQFATTLNPYGSVADFFQRLWDWFRSVVNS
jgi:hypothetical protein